MRKRRYEGEARGNMKDIAKGLMSLVIVAVCLAFTPVAARVGLLIRLMSWVKR
jgi:hypothetical protein